MAMRLLTVKDVAEMLAIKEKTLYQWAESRQIPSLKMNGALRFDLEDIQQWITTCKNTPSGGYNSFAQTASVRSPKKEVKN